MALPVSERGREEGGGCSGSGARQTRPGTREPVQERDSERRPRPGSPSFQFLSPPPGPPLPPGGAVSPPRVSRRSLHCLCLYNRFGRRGRGRVRGCPSPGFLGAAFLPQGVRVLGCIYSAPELIPLRSRSWASQTPPSQSPPIPLRRLGSPCGNDERIGGSKFFTRLRGPPFSFLGNQIVLILLISKPEAAGGEAHAIFSLDSKNLFDFYFYF